MDAGNDIFKYIDMGKAIKIDAGNDIFKYIDFNKVITRLN